MFVNHIFNARMQSTQQVEEINSVLKHLIDHHSTLYELFHDMEKESKWKILKMILQFEMIFNITGHIKV